MLAKAIEAINKFGEGDERRAFLLEGRDPFAETLLHPFS
jgi:hypothetical protein